MAAGFLALAVGGGMGAGGRATGQWQEFETLLGLRSPGTRGTAGLVEVKAPSAADAAAVGSPNSDFLNLNALQELKGQTVSDRVVGLESTLETANLAPLTLGPSEPMVQGGLSNGLTGSTAVLNGPGFGGGPGFSSIGAGGTGGGGLDPGTGGALPEPETWQTLISGFALIGAIARRQRAAGRRARNS